MSSRTSPQAWQRRPPAIHPPTSAEDPPLGTHADDPEPHDSVRPLSYEQARAITRQCQPPGTGGRHLAAFVSYAAVPRAELLADVHAAMHDAARAGAP